MTYLSGVVAGHLAGQLFVIVEHVLTLKESQPAMDKKNNTIIHRENSGLSFIKAVHLW